MPPGHLHVVQRSTSALYADRAGAWVAENWPTAPSPALAHAYRGKVLVADHIRRGGRGTILRLGHLYGTSNPWSRQLVVLARRGWLPLDGPDDAYFPAVDVADAAAAVMRALERPPGTYNVGDTNPLTNAEVNAQLARAAGRTELHPLWAARTPARRQLLERSCRLDSGRFQRDTGWRPSISAAASLAATALAIASRPRNQRTRPPGSSPAGLTTRR